MTSRLSTKDQGTGELKAAYPDVNLSKISLRTIPLWNWRKINKLNGKKAMKLMKAICSRVKTFCCSWEKKLIRPNSRV